MSDLSECCYGMGFGPEGDGVELHSLASDNLRANPCKMNLTATELSEAAPKLEWVVEGYSPEDWACMPPGDRGLFQVTVGPRTQQHGPKGPRIGVEIDKHTGITRVTGYGVEIWSGGDSKSHGIEITQGGKGDIDQPERFICSTHQVGSFENIQWPQWAFDDKPESNAKPALPALTRQAGEKYKGLGFCDGLE